MAATGRQHNYLRAVVGLVLFAAVTSVTVWRLTRSHTVAIDGPDPAAGGRGVIPTGNAPVGPGYTAVVESTGLVHGALGVTVYGRVLFYSHGHLSLRGVHLTTGETHVAPAWLDQCFLIASRITPDPSGQVPGGTRIVEFDPSRNTTTGEYTHPRAPSLDAMAGFPYEQRSVIARGGDGALWILTEVLEPGGGRQQLEAVRWTDKAVRVVYHIPAGDYNRATTLPLDVGCALLVSAPTGSAVRVFTADGLVGEVPLGLAANEVVRFPHAAGRLVAGCTSEGRVVVAEWDAGQGRGAVRFRRKPDVAGEVRAVVLVPEEDAVLLGLSPTPTAPIDRVAVLSAADGAVVREGPLESPAVGISYGDKHVWAFSRATSRFTAYDTQLQLVRRQPQPLIEVVELRP